MILKYTSSAGVKFDLDSANIPRIKDANFHTSIWKYSYIEKQYGVDITEFKKDAAEYELKLIFTGEEEKRKRYLDNFHSEIEKDIISKTPGRFQWEQWYADCYVISSSTYPGDKPNKTMNDVVLLVPGSFWISEQSLAIYKSDTIPDSSGIIYDYTYGSAYGDSGLSVNFYNDHFIPCNFVLEAKGPLSKLEFAINENLYEINVSCAEGESVVLDTKERTIKVIDSYGNSWNAFGKQNFDFDNFAKIPAGENVISYNRSYDIYLTIYQERSEPRWTAGIKYMLTEDGYVLATEKDQILALG